MKKIKFLILTIALLIGFVCEAEIFQLELWNFEDAYFRSSVFKTENEAERIELVQKIEALAKENQVGIFVAEMKFVDLHNSELHILCNPLAKEAIIKETNIKQERYESLISGNTDVIYKEFAECYNYDNRYMNCIWYTGEKKAIVNVHNQLKDQYNITYPQFYGGSEKDIIYAVWGLLAVVMVVLTVMQVYFSKKEVVVRISFGESVWKIIRQNVIYEIIQNIGLFFITQYFVFCFVSGKFMQMEIFGIYLAGMLLSCLMYLSYAVYDIKMAFANASNASNMLFGLYVTKVVVSIVTIMGVGFNFSIVNENRNYLNKEEYMQNYKDYSYFFLIDNVRVDSRLSDDEELDEEEYRESEEIPKIVRNIYKEYYDVTNPIICVNILESTSSYIMANEHAGKLIEEFIELEDTDEDILIIMPESENEKNVMEEVDFELDFMFDNPDGITQKVIKYNGHRPFAYIHQSAKTGMQTTTNPVIVYVQNKELSKELKISEYAQDILFQIDSATVEQIEKEYQLDEMEYSISISDFMENYEYYQGFLRKVLGLLSSVSTVLLLLLLVLIVIINTLEYQVNATKLALKKVSGYSMLEKNGKTLFVCVGIDLLVAIGVTGYMMHIGKRTAILSTIEVALLVTGLEFLVCMINIYRIEKRSIVKILKGGCL